MVLGHILLMQFSRLGGSKMKISEADFFDTLTIQNDQISYVKHVLAPLHVFFIPAPLPLYIGQWILKMNALFMCFSHYFGGGGGGLPRGLGHNLLMQFSGLGSSKIEISETDSFDTLTIQNDQISYVKHVLAPLYVSRHSHFTLEPKGTCPSMPPFAFQPLGFETMVPLLILGIPNSAQLHYVPV